jgi:hypothetical protein
MTYMVRITGKKAVEYAEAHGVTIEQGGARIARHESDFRSLLEGDEDWDAAADDGDELVYVEIPAPYAVARYAGAGEAIADIEYFQSVEDARTAFVEAEVPPKAEARVHLVEVDEDGEPLRVLVEKRGAHAGGRTQV